MLCHCSEPPEVVDGVKLDGCDWAITLRLGGATISTQMTVCKVCKQENVLMLKKMRGVGRKKRLSVDQECTVPCLGNWILARLRKSGWSTDTFHLPGDRLVRTAHVLLITPAIKKSKTKTPQEATCSLLSVGDLDNVSNGQASIEHIFNSTTETIANSMFR